MLRWVRRIFQKLDSQPAWGLSAASGRTKEETLLPKVVFWSPHAHHGTWATPCNYSIGTFHQLPAPSLAFICLFARVFLSLCCSCSSFPTTPGDISAEFLCSGLSSAVVFFSKPICCLPLLLLNHCSNGVHPEHLLTVMPMSFCGPRLMAPGLLLGCCLAWYLLPSPFLRRARTWSECLCCPFKHTKRGPISTVQVVTWACAPIKFAKQYILTTISYNCYLFQSIFFPCSPLHQLVSELLWHFWDMAQRKLLGIC